MASTNKYPLTVMYIEVNGSNFLNIGCYNLADDEKPLIDIGIIFAANINYDVNEKRAVLHFNNNVTTVLENVEKYVRPLQARGVKVLLSILGNHQGAGICNFPDKDAARDFAIQLAEAVEIYGLDGIEFDDEYAEYGRNGTGPPNPFSFVYLLRELRNLIPDKIIAFYYYGPASSRLTFEDLTAGDFLDYSWNSIYGTYIVPNVPKLTKEQLGPAAIHVNVTNSPTANYLAQRTIDDGYGIYLCYNLTDRDSESYLSGISSILYGRETKLKDNCLSGWPPGSKI